MAKAKGDVNNEADYSAGTSKLDNVLWDMFDKCVNTRVQSSTSTCLKLQLLHYLDANTSRFTTTPSITNDDVEKIDQLVVKRVFDVDIELPKTEGRADDESSDSNMTQQNELLPLLALLKLKLKLITPIMLALVSAKATKALIMSKLALLVVTIFIFFQLFTKLKMKLPMLQAAGNDMATSIVTPAVYGTPSIMYGSHSSGYGASELSSNHVDQKATTWDASPSSSDIYSNYWDAQKIAYNSYYKSNNQVSHSTTLPVTSS